MRWCGCEMDGWIHGTHGWMDGWMDEICENIISVTCRFFLTVCDRSVLLSRCVRCRYRGRSRGRRLIVDASDELIRAQPEIALLLSRLESLIEARGDRIDASGDSQIRKLNELLRLVSQGLKFEPLRAYWAAFEAPPVQPCAQPSDLSAGIRPQEPQDTASATPEAPVYQFFTARTVSDAWREWTEGIAGGPAVRDLESTWGHRWCPEPKAQVAWNRRKEILNEVQRLINRGHSEETAVAELLRGVEAVGACESLLTNSRPGKRRRGWFRGTWDISGDTGG